MKMLKYLPIALLLVAFPAYGWQEDTTDAEDAKYVSRTLTIEPALGINLYPNSDLLLTNVVQWNLDHRWGVVSLSSIAYNNAFLRDYNYIRTNYNWSLSQKFGFGASLYTDNFSHTFSLLAGIRYDSFKETLENPELPSFSASITSLSPDVGLMYHLRTGRGQYFFSFRTYIPLYPYPMKTVDAWAIDGNMANLSLEFGVGFWLN